MNVCLFCLKCNGMNRRERKCWQIWQIKSRCVYQFDATRWALSYLFAVNLVSASRATPNRTLPGSSNQQREPDNRANDGQAKQNAEGCKQHPALRFAICNNSGKGAPCLNIGRRGVWGWLLLVHAFEPATVKELRNGNGIDAHSDGGSA